MKAFVAGATGLTGREVVAQLVAAGVETTAHVRSDSSKLGEWRSHFETMGASVDVTPWEDAAMCDTLARLAPNLVFALLGTTRKRVDRSKAQGVSESYASVDYGLSAVLLRAAIACPSRPRFIYLSSMGVGESASSAYLAVRHRLETELRASALPWVIARPSFILGDRDERRPFESMGAGVGDALLGFAGALGARRLRDRYSSMTNVELARALVRAACEPQSEKDLLEADALRALAR